MWWKLLNVLIFVFIYGFVSIILSRAVWYCLLIPLVSFSLNHKVCGKDFSLAKTPSICRNKFIISCIYFKLVSQKENNCHSLDIDTKTLNSMLTPTHFLIMTLQIPTGQNILQTNVTFIPFKLHVYFFCYIIWLINEMFFKYYIIILSSRNCCGEVA